MTNIVQTLKFKLAFFFILALVWSQPSFALRCEDLFSANDVIQLSRDVPGQIKNQPRTSIEKIRFNLNQFMQRFKPQQMSLKMVAHLFDSVKNLVADATGKRVENKVTAASQVVQTALNRFKEKLAAKGIELVDRDQKIPGKRNVTYTEYTRPFSVKLSDLMAAGFEIRADYKNRLNKKVTVKIRIRSYGTVDETKAEFGISDIEFAPFTKDRAFVELKFEDPSYEGAVFKPQAYMNKDFIHLFGTPAFLKQYHNIETETLSSLRISSKKTLNETTVRALLGFLYEAHKENLNLSIVATNIYERAAKSVTLAYKYQQDPKHNPLYGTDDTVTLEMTFDQLVALYLPGSTLALGEAQYYKAYGPDQTVSEFKTLTRIAHHLKRAMDEAKALGREGLIVSPAHAKELDSILQGLKEYFEMMDEIIQSRDTSKELNRGKWGVALKKVRSQIENILNRFYMDDDQVAH